MHNNYFFLRSLAPALELKLRGKQLVSCYSQEKDELMLVFSDAPDTFIIRAHFQPSFSCLYFPEQHARAKRNTVNLFPEILNQTVGEVRCHSNERALTVALSNSRSITFKLFGNRSNVIIYQENEATQIFRSVLKNDLEVNLSDLDRELDLSFDTFAAVDGNPIKFLPTLGKMGREYLFLQGYRAQTLEGQYEMIIKLIESLESPVFHITDWQEQITLSLFRIGDVRSTYSNPIEALNQFYLTYQREGNLLREKRRAGDLVRKDLERSLRYIEKNQMKLIEIRDQTNYRQMADLIMAHMHEIRQGEKLVTLPDFYQNNQSVEIKLKPDLSPQKNAENYYRRAKNQHLETDRLEKNIRKKREQMEEQKALLEKIDSAETVRDLKKILSGEILAGDIESNTKPFHIFNHMGFQIWLGKSGKANDQMLRLSHKNDLWLHAKDVAGAHVIIRHNAGTGFPADVKEKAAALAAFHSKRKNDSLCPVIVSQRKFIRKRKGAPAGEVAVDREEEILLVTPKNWD